MSFGACSGGSVRGLRRGPMAPGRRRAAGPAARVVEVDAQGAAREVQVAREDLRRLLGLSGGEGVDQVVLFGGHVVGHRPARRAHRPMGENRSVRSCFRPSVGGYGVGRAARARATGATSASSVVLLAGPVVQNPRIGSTTAARSARTRHRQHRPALEPGTELHQSGEVLGAELVLQPFLDVVDVAPMARRRLDRVRPAGSRRPQQLGGTGGVAGLASARTAAPSNASATHASSRLSTAASTAARWCLVALASSRRSGRGTRGWTRRGQRLRTTPRRYQSRAARWAASARASWRWARARTPTRV